MSREEMQSIARQFYYDVVNKADFGSASRILAENFRDHDIPPETREGIEGLRRLLSMLVTAFPDMRVDIVDMAVDNDTVAVRLVVSGTQRGYLMGTIPPSGKHAIWTGIDFLKVSNGKIVERWGVRDRLGLMQQIGAIKN